MIENHMVITTGADLERERFESQWESEMDERTEEWANEIQSCFDDVLPSNVHRKVFPRANYKEGSIEQINLASVIERRMDDELAEKLAQVIANSDCKLVKEFKDLLCKNYIDWQADALAEVGEV